MGNENYVNLIRKKAIRLQTINAALQDLPAGDRRAAFAQEDEEIHNWLAKQFDVLIETIHLSTR